MARRYKYHSEQELRDERECLENLNAEHSQTMDKAVAKCLDARFGIQRAEALAFVSRVANAYRRNFDELEEIEFEFLKRAEIAAGE